MAVPAVFVLQEIHGGLGIRLVLIEGMDAQLAVTGAAAAPKLRVDVVLGERKSGGRFHALRSVDVLDLFFLGGEQGQC